MKYVHERYLLKKRVCYVILQRVLQSDLLLFLLVSSIQVPACDFACLQLHTAPTPTPPQKKSKIKNIKESRIRQVRRMYTSKKSTLVVRMKRRVRIEQNRRKKKTLHVYCL